MTEGGNDYDADNSPTSVIEVVLNVEYPARFAGSHPILFYQNVMHGGNATSNGFNVVERQLQLYVGVRRQQKCILKS